MADFQIDGYTIPVQIDGQGVEITHALREFIHEKIRHVLLHFHLKKTNNIHFVLSKSTRFAYDASVHVAIPGTVFHSQSESEDMYKSIDLLMEHLSAQLRKHHERNSVHHES